MFTLPADIPTTDIEGDSHANDPGSADYNAAAPTWVGQDYTFNGGTGHDINVNDDDSFFDDGYVDDGSAQTLADAITINGVTYPAGSTIENEFSLLDAAGNEVYVLRINGVNVGFVYPVGNEPTAGQTFTSSAGRDGDPLDSADGQSSSTNYSSVDTRDGIVDGTQGADLIDASYTDPEGDRVDRFNGAGANNSDVVYAGGGNDTVYSGADTDTVYGGQGNDYIDGGEGHDSLHGGEGADTIYGGIGNDSIEGGTGNDSVSGGDGNDTVAGGDGNDTLYGNAGDDRIGGDAGNDSILGGAGNDTLGGGAGVDTIRGGDGNDSIEGGAGNDHLYDDAGTDTVYGGAGDDRLYMGAGNDSLHGGAGSDYFIANDGFGQDTVTGGEDVGSDSYDFIDFRGHTQSVTVTYSGFEAGSATAGTDTVTFSETEAIWLSHQADSVDASANTGFTGIGAGAGNDTVITGAGDDIVIGEAGDDSIEGNAGSDTLDGGLGSDTVHGGTGGDSLYGGGGIDSIRGGDGDDVIYGGTEGDSLYGDAGADWIEGEAGDDRIEGGAGGDYLDGGEGNDALRGDGGNDVIVGGGGDDTVSGGDGNDTIAGGTGTDRLIGGQGSDSIEGGDGNDYLQGDSRGTSQTDLSSGGASSDASTEPDGNDTLSGGAGNDRLHGGGGGDELTGGDGNDFFYVSEGHDTVTDFNVGNTGALGDGDTSNNDFLNLGKYYDSLDELRADQADDGVLNHSNERDEEGEVIDYSNNARFDKTSHTMTVNNADSSTYTYDNTGIVCFAASTRVMTPEGEVAIETLQPGDLVNTLDHGPQPLLWVGRRHVNDAELIANEELRPVLITQGALGNGRDLLVSRQHGMMIGADHLVRAIHLARDMPGVRIANGRREVTYIHLFFAQHEIVFAEGIASESFYPGPEALKLLSPNARSELLEFIPSLLFPEAWRSTKATEAIYGKPARPFAKLSDLERKCGAAA